MISHKARESTILHEQFFLGEVVVLVDCESEMNGFNGEIHELVSFQTQDGYQAIKCSHVQSLNHVHT